MAKIAWIERNKRKAETVKKYAAIRAELKAKRDYAGLAKLPRDASPSPGGQPLLDERPPPRLPAQVWLLASDLPRGCSQRPHPGRDQSQLVIL